MGLIQHLLLYELKTSPLAGTCVTSLRRLKSGDIWSIHPEHVRGARARSGAQGTVTESQVNLTHRRDSLAGGRVRGCFLRLPYNTLETIP